MPYFPPFTFTNAKRSTNSISALATTRTTTIYTTRTTWIMAISKINTLWRSVLQTTKLAWNNFNCTVDTWQIEQVQIIWWLFPYTNLDWQLCLTVQFTGKFPQQIAYCADLTFSARLDIKVLKQNKATIQIIYDLLTISGNMVLIHNLNKWQKCNSFWCSVTMSNHKW